MSKTKLVTCGRQFYFKSANNVGCACWSASALARCSRFSMITASQPSGEHGLLGCSFRQLAEKPLFYWKLPLLRLGDTNAETLSYPHSVILSASEGPPPMFVGHTS